MIITRLSCDSCLGRTVGPEVTFYGQVNKARIREQSPGWTTRQGRDKCPACSTRPRKDPK